MMSATPTDRPTFSSEVENGVIFSQNSYMPVLESNHGTSSYGFPQWGFLEYGNSSTVFDSNTTGASDVTSASIQLYNTATSGNFRPYNGSFSVYVIPDDTKSGLANSGPLRNQAGQVGVDALGSTGGGPSTLGITGTTSDWLVGTWSITDATMFPGGYSTFTGSTSGSTTVAGGASGSAAVLGSAARSAIAADLNNHTPLRFAVVANDTNFAADWEGNFSSSQPLLTLDITRAPDVYFNATNFAVESTPGIGITTPASSGTYTVTESDQILANSTTATLSVTRTSNPNTTTVVHWAVTGGTAPLTGATSGDVAFNPGDTNKPFDLHFQNITTTDAFRTVTVTLTDPGQTLGNPAPVFATSGNTATARINYLQAGNVAIHDTSYAANEVDGTVRVYVDRTGSNVATTAADVTLTTSDGLPYLTSFQDPQDAEAGRDFGTAGNATAPSFPVHFNVGQAQSFADIPLINIPTFAGVRSFSASLSSPSVGTQIITPSQTTINITDNAVVNSDTPSGVTTHSSGVEVNGPFNIDSFIALVSAPQGSFGFADMPVITFGSGSAVFPNSYTVQTVDSLKLSIYNTATTGGFGGTPGSFDVYLLTDDLVPDGDLRYQGGTGNTGPSVIGTQAAPLFIGTAEFPNNQVGYNDFVFDNLSGAAKTELATRLNSSGASQVRLAIMPSAGSLVAADWEGNFVSDPPKQPVLTALVEKTGGNSTVAGREIFYNQSAYDGTTAASGLAINFFSDNLAIAPDKTAYLPGDPKAVAVNVTNYSRGINGIIIDLSTTGGTHQSITAADFVFKVGNNNIPSSWAAAPAPNSVAVSLGFGGNDRVEITWPSGSINNKWLEVQMLNNSRTGLAAPDVFFWGNRIADSASGTLDNNNFVTNSTDAAQVFATLTPANGAAITNVRDYNRDKTVNSTDAAIVFAQLGNLNRLQIGSAGPFAPDGGDLGGGDAGISSALAGGGGGSASGSTGQALPTAHLPTAIRERLDGAPLASRDRSSAAYFASLAADLPADDDANGTNDALDSDDLSLESVLADLGLA